MRHILFVFLYFSCITALSSQTKDSISSGEEGCCLGGQPGFQDEWDYVTDRNWPTLNLDTFDIIECRKTNKQPVSIIKSTNESKKHLLQSLKDKDISVAISSALSLYRLNDYNNVINFFLFNYKSFHYDFENHDNFEAIHNTLLKMNTALSAEVLRRIIKEHKNDFFKLDGLAALSLMGYCDEAYNGFKEILEKNDNGNLQKEAISCLAFYIGTQDAFSIIEKYQDKNPNLEGGEAKKMFKNYQINKK